MSFKECFQEDCSSVRSCVKLERHSPWLLVAWVLGRVT